MTNKYLPEQSDIEKEPWQDLFEANKVYKNSKWKGYLVFFRMFFSQKSKTISMYYKTQLFLNLIPKQLLFPLIILALLVSTGSVAQAIAPNEYKPTNLISNLFSANKQKDKDPYSALNPDSENEVGFLEGCDLAVKYPKKIDNKMETGVTVLRSSSNPDMPYEALQYFSIGPKKPDSSQDYDEKLYSSYSYGTISCYPLNSVRFNSIQESIKLGYTSTISKETLIKETGWFITQGDIKDIYVSSNKQFPAQLNLYFVYNNKFYDLSFNLQSDGENSLNNKKGIYANQIQLQFNSLVKNQQSVDFNLETFTKNQAKQNQELLTKLEKDRIEMTKETKSNITLQTPKLKEDLNSKIYSFEECGLQIKLPKDFQVVKNDPISNEEQTANEINPAFVKSSSIAINNAQFDPIGIGCNKDKGGNSSFSNTLSIAKSYPENTFGYVKNKTELPIFTKDALNYITSEVLVQNPKEILEKDPTANRVSNWQLEAQNGYIYYMSINMEPTNKVEVSFLGN